MCASTLCAELCIVEVFYLRKNQNYAEISNFLLMHTLSGIASNLYLDLLKQS